ncbi:UNVERIFIED_CONTAM: hypothetical protein FKN15_041346 [Acipenser sinensis]
MQQLSSSTHYSACTDIDDSTATCVHNVPCNKEKGGPRSDRFEYIANVHV